MSMRNMLGTLILALLCLFGQTTAQQIDLYHDKANWQPAFEATIALAPQETGVEVNVVPYADMSSYQAAVRAALRTPQAPGLFTWWSGYRMEDLVASGMVEDLTSIWQK